MREWKPGDLAVDEHGSRYLYAGERMAGVSKPWRGADGDNYWGDFDLRPLVAIDPEDREQVERLSKCYMDLANGHAELLNEPWTMPGMRMRQALHHFLSPPPPPLEEPSTWGVVEAACVHSQKRREWVRFPGGNWHCVRDFDDRPGDIENPDDWESLVEPVLVRDGVQP